MAGFDRVLMQRGVLMAGLLLGGCGNTWYGAPEDPPLPGERKAIRAAVTAPVMGTVAASPLPAPVANSAWPQSGGTSDRAPGHVLLSPDPQLAWSVDAGTGKGAGARVYASPVVAGGRVYTLDANAQISAHFADTGRKAWSRSLVPEGEDGEEGYGGGMVATADAVFVATGFGEVHALDANSGATIWVRKIGAPVRSAPLLSAGRIFVITRNDSLVALDGASGRELWRAAGAPGVAGYGAGGSPASAEGAVIAPFSSGEIAAFNLADGRRAWAQTLNATRRGAALAAIADVSASPVISNRTVFVGSIAGVMAAHDLMTGQRRWVSDLAAVGKPYVAGDAIFVMTAEAKLYRLRSSDGGIVWSSQLQAHIDPNDPLDGALGWSTPLLAGSRLWMANANGELLAIDPATGAVLRTTKLPAGTYGSMAVAASTLFIFGTDGRLMALR